MVIKKTNFTFFKRLVILGFISCVSCSKIVTVKISEQIPKPVLSCLFTNDSIFKVDLSMSSSIFNEPVSFQNGEVIKLFGNGELVDSLQWDGEHYISIITPQSNIDYKIEWEKDDAKITSSDCLPEKVFIESSELRNGVGFNEYGEPYSECTLVFKDDPLQKNFYEILLVNKYIRDDKIVFSSYPLFSSDPVIISEGLLDYEPWSILLSDELINGKSHELKINYDLPFQPDNPNYELIVQLRSVSEQYYKYAKSLTIHKFYQESSIWNGMGSPVPMFSNIVGGYGIFAAYSVTTDTISNTIKR